jgi:hypothetical protein
MFLLIELDVSVCDIAVSAAQLAFEVVDSARLLSDLQSLICC